MRCKVPRQKKYLPFCAGAPRDLLQKVIALLRVQLGPVESAHGFRRQLPVLPMAAAEERQGVSVRALGRRFVSSEPADILRLWTPA